MSDSVWPHRWQPTRLSHPWDSPGKNTGVGYHFLLQCMKVKSEREVDQSCPTLCDPIDGSPPGSFVHGIFQARVLEWYAITFSEWISFFGAEQWSVQWKHQLRKKYFIYFIFSFLFLKRGNFEYDVNKNSYSPSHWGDARRKRWVREVSILVFSHLYSWIVKNCLYCHGTQILPDMKLLIEQLINNNMTSYSWENKQLTSSSLLPYWYHITNESVVF